MMLSEWHFTILFCATILDMLVGDPDWIWRKYTHPIVWFGQITGYMDKRFNSNLLSQAHKKFTGIMAIVMLVAIAVILGLLFTAILSNIGFLGYVLEVIIVAIFIAQKSMSDHVERIITPLRNGDINGARNAVSMIVGRDTAQLDESSISRAAIESMSENFSDGVVAPIFWYAIFGLPGLFAYKMINTADSMLGHMTEKYQDFGWASAKVDDLVNWFPARLSALFIIFASGLGARTKPPMSVVKVVLKDAKHHRSPNAGWPESAMAGALDIALAGPRTYSEYKVDDAFMNATGRKKLTFIDVELAKIVFLTACLIEAFVVVILITINHSF
ncbi:adenosylcobinamide-phosphate synthase CbiB [Lentilitoribacter sp. EG35]